MAVEKVVYKSVPKNEKQNNPPVYEAPKGFGVRHAQTAIIFMSLSIAVSMRAQLSVSMVAMTSTNSQNRPCSSQWNSNNTEDLTNSNAPRIQNVSCGIDHWNSSEANHTEECLTEFNNTDRNGAVCINYTDPVNSWSVYRTYNWSKPTQEMIMFSFFVGYTSMNFPMGIIAQKFGGKLPIMIALGANGVLSFLTPWLAVFGGWIAVCCCRFLQGVAQAALYPSIHTLLGKWAPLSERGRLSTYIYAGTPFGTIIGFQMAGLLAGSPTFGWPWSFWVCGVISLTCFGFIVWFCSATPHEHRGITAEELAYISGDGNADIIPKKRKTPWRQIFTSPPFWGIVVTHAGSAIGFLFMLTQTPTYMSKVLGVDIKRNGLYSSLPYICLYIMTLVFGYLSDLVANKKIMTIVNIRRTANTIGMVVCGLFMLAFCYSSDTATAVIMLIVGLGLHSGVHVGFNINYIELAPNFAGSQMAVGNTIANLAGLLIPVLLSTIVKDDVKNQYKWQIVFIVIVAIQVVTNTIYLILAKGTVQPWNFHGDEEIEPEEVTQAIIKQERKMSLIEEI